MKPPSFVFFTWVLLLPAVVASIAGPAVAEEPGEAKKPDHQVGVMYFHRTERCLACMQAGLYVEQALDAKFARERKEKRVTLSMIDFQNPANAKYVEGYAITGPALIVVDLHGGKVTRWKTMPDIWSLIGRKDDFFKYVQDGVTEYLETP